MDKEQLKKILEPLKKICKQYIRCEGCPLADGYYCLIKASFLHRESHISVDNITKPYVEMINKCTHEFCGKDSCKTCPQKCVLCQCPENWNFDELP